MLKSLHKISRELKSNLAVYRLALKDPRSPKLAKILLGAAVFYAVLPFDFIPDFIPVIGRLDDAIIVPILVQTALKLIPEDVMQECRESVRLSLRRRTRKRH